MTKRDWKCPNVGRCPQFPRLESEARLREALDVSCFDDYASCARYRHVKTTGTMPPSGLLPTGEMLDDES